MKDTNVTARAHLSKDQRPTTLTGLGVGKEDPEKIRRISQRTHDRQRPACRPDQMVLAAETGSHRGQCAQFRCHPDRGGYRPYNRKGVAMAKRRTLGEHQTRHARQHVILACSATSHASHWTPNLTDRQTKNIRVACASPSEELACVRAARRHAASITQSSSTPVHGVRVQHSQLFVATRRRELATHMVFHTHVQGSLLSAAKRTHATHPIMRARTSAVSLCGDVRTCTATGRMSDGESLAAKAW